MFYPLCYNFSPSQAGEGGKHFKWGQNNICFICPPPWQNLYSAQGLRAVVKISQLEQLFS